jgi:hypothetical protein
VSGLRRNQVAEDGVAVAPDAAYDTAPTHLVAIRNFIRFTALRTRRLRTAQKADALSEQIDEANRVVSSLTHHASINRWSQEIIWSSVFVGFVFDFLLWQDIFTGRFELGALSNAATRASAVVCSLAYAYVCSQLGIAAFLKRASVRRRRATDDPGDDIERTAFRRAVWRESLYLWSFLFILLTGVSIVGRFTQEGTVTDHSLLTLVSVAIAFVIAVMAYQYHDIYAHDLRAAKSFIAKRTKDLDAFTEEIDGLDLRATELSLMGSLLACDCGRRTCPVGEIRVRMGIDPHVVQETHEEHQDETEQPSDDSGTEQEVATGDVETVVEVVEEPKATTEEGDDVVMLKRLYTMTDAPSPDEKQSLLDQIAAKTEELENLNVEVKYWKSKARQYKVKHGKLDELVSKLVNAVLEKGSQPMFYRVVNRHRSEWGSLWSVIDEMLVEYGDGVATT